MTREQALQQAQAEGVTLRTANSKSHSRSELA